MSDLFLRYDLEYRVEYAVWRGVLCPVPQHHRGHADVLTGDWCPLSDAPRASYGELQSSAKMADLRPEEARGMPR